MAVAGVFVKKWTTTGKKLEVMGALNHISFAEVSGDTVDPADFDKIAALIESDADRESLRANPFSPRGRRIRMDVAELAERADSPGAVSVDWVAVSPRGAVFGERPQFSFSTPMHATVEGVAIEMVADDGEKITWPIEADHIRRGQKTVGLTPPENVQFMPVACTHGVSSGPSMPSPATRGSRDPTRISRWRPRERRTPFDPVLPRSNRRFGARSSSPMPCSPAGLRALAWNRWNELVKRRLMGPNGVNSRFAPRPLS